MAYDVVLEIKDIEGESRTEGFESQIDVLAWSFGASQAGTFHSGGGGGGGKADVQDLSVTKWIDKATPVLALYCLTGEHIDEATLTVRKAGGKKGSDALPYVIFKMKKLMVTSVSHGGSGGEDRFTENVTLNFAEFEWKYSEQSDKGDEMSSKTLSWNVEANSGDCS